MNRRQNPQTALEKRGVFMQQAKKIGYDLSQTFVKLEQLTLSKCFSNMNKNIYHNSMTV